VQGLATPQIRHLATSAAIRARSRCWYFRNPHIACPKKAGLTVRASGKSPRPFPRGAASFDDGGGAAGL
jgi:hypothetical protein